MRIKKMLTLNRHICLLCAVLCVMISVTACENKTDNGSENNTSLSTDNSANKARKCDPQNTSGIDCDCVEGLIKNHWSDYDELDAVAILASTDNNMSQQSIDILIDVTLEAGETCVSVQ